MASLEENIVKIKENVSIIMHYDLYVPKLYQSIQSIKPSKTSMMIKIKNTFSSNE